MSLPFRHPSPRIGVTSADATPVETADGPSSEPRSSRSRRDPTWLGIERRKSLSAADLAARRDPPRFPDVEALVREVEPDHPVLCLRPDELRRLARGFTAGFEGTPLYAVKCNPEPFVLRTLFEAGISGFDVASLEEVERIDGLFGASARMFFNNPAKCRNAIRRSFEDYDVRFFTVDHPDELEKVVEETRGDGGDVGVAVRLAVHAPESRYALSTKFGAPAALASRLLRQAAAAGLHAGLSFHVGSQCLDPGAFGRALMTCRDVMRDAATEIGLLNIGGGFPAPYPGDDSRRIDDYFGAAALGRRALGLPPECLVLCEPGRALVGTAASVVMQVLMRRDDTLYCNDGIYGNLQELRSPKERRPARLIARRGGGGTGATPFKIYGPTCDSDDVLGAPLPLPEDVREGDWIEIGMMGAYSSATRTAFNGFCSHSTVQIPGIPR